MVERRTIPIKDISLDKYTSRGEAGWVNDVKDQELLASIRGLGLIQDLIVRPNPTETGKFSLIAGKRRITGMEKAGATHVDCKILELDDLEALKLSLGENMGRKELTDSEMMNSINTWYHMIKDPINIKPNQKYDVKAIKQIAPIMYGRYSDNSHKLIVQQLRISALPGSLKLLLKKPEERTVKENRELKEAGVDPSYSVDFATLDRLGSVARTIGYDTEEKAEEAEKLVFQFITQTGLPEKSNILQLELISTFNKSLTEVGYSRALKDILDSSAVSLKETVSVTLRIPSDYFTWHKRLMVESHTKTNIELVRKVYLAYLNKEAKQRGWS